MKREVRLLMDQHRFSEYRGECELAILKYRKVRRNIRMWNSEIKKRMHEHRRQLSAYQFHVQGPEREGDIPLNSLLVSLRYCTLMWMPPSKLAKYYPFEQMGRIGDLAIRRPRKY